MDIILGADSMIGNHLQKLLPQAVLINHKTHDLLSLDDCRKAFSCRPENVYNLSGFNGGLPFNLAFPADIYYQSTQMNLNILKCCEEFKVNKVISIISACSYPDSGVHLEEDELLRGHPNYTVECHGFAKRVIYEYSRQLYKQFRMKSISAVLTNSYGPYDRFDLQRTKVVGAAVRKICEAELNNAPSITFFGTGTPVRELMYAGDAAKALKTLIMNYEDYLNPINVGSDQMTSIFNLVEMIADIVGYKGEIKWDTSKPDGQAFRKLSTDKMKDYVRFEMTPLAEGLRETIDYYMSTGRFLNR